MDNDAKKRYGRQLILPELGIRGQTLLSESKVLIIGAGGLGCPCAIYLAAAGIGVIGIVDYDRVEISNLHRQVQHNESRIGDYKCHSLADACQALNSELRVLPYAMSLSSENALNLCRQYDVIVDCTDNVASRYLINDAAVLTHRPLVSGSALRFEGQLTIYNYKNGPCYRCLFPVPPPPETVTNCSDGGVIGTTPGIIGTLQAQEVIKIISGLESGFEGKMLLFDSLECTFRRINLRSKVKGCAVCGENATIKELINYEQFCGSIATDKDNDVVLIDEEHRISAKEYNKYIEIENHDSLLIDIRPVHELLITQITDSINIPLSELMKIKECSNLNKYSPSLNSRKKLFIICRKGNDSQKAVLHLQSMMPKDIDIKDIIGGLYSWHLQIDNSISIY